MSSAFSVKIDTTIVERGLARCAKEIPYAMKTALNEIGTPLQAALRESLPEYFTIRNQFVPNAFRYFRSATKKRQYIEVGPDRRRWFMRSQAEGDESREKPSGADIFIPVTTGPKRPRPVLNKPIPRGRMPDQARKAGGLTKAERAKRYTKKGEKKKRYANAMGYILFDASTKMRVPGIYYRDGDGKRLRLAYVIKSDITVKKVWPVREIVRDATAKHWPGAATRAVAHAIETSIDKI